MFQQFTVYTTSMRSRSGLASVAILRATTPKRPFHASTLLDYVSCPCGLRLKVVISSCIIKTRDHPLSDKPRQDVIWTRSDNKVEYRTCISLPNYGC
jgi:hypothetical protein